MKKYSSFILSWVSGVLTMTERIKCPLCGWIRPIPFGISQHTGKPREVRFDNVDLEHDPILRTERLTGAGRGSKNAKIELVDSKTLAELPAEIKTQIKSQCWKILEILGEEDE
jgi:hypothetical protein